MIETPQTADNLTYYKRKDAILCGLFSFNDLAEAPASIRLGVLHASQHAPAFIGYVYSMDSGPDASVQVVLCELPEVVCSRHCGHGEAWHFLPLVIGRFTRPNEVKVKTRHRVLFGPLSRRRPSSLRRRIPRQHALAGL